jgi:glycosyltransferase involved in cell wall biosynthesis
VTRVLHVIDTSLVGGGQTALGHMLAGLRGSGVLAELACADGGPLVDAARAAGAPFHPVAFDKRFLPDKALRVARIVRRSGIQLVHSHGLLATYYCTLARRAFGARVPLVYQQHGFHHHNHGRLTRRARMATERLLARDADRVLAASRADLERLERGGYAPRAHLRLLHYGLPTPDPSAEQLARAATHLEAGDRPVVGLVARLHPQKGVDTFLRAAAIARRLHPRALFAVVGVGPLETEMRELATALGLDGSVRFACGTTPGTAYMPAFAVGVVASRWEGLPLVLLEYMATARPVVATAVDGCLDAASPEEARLVPPDDPPAMAEAIVALLADPAEARRRGAAARARFERDFSLGSMVERLRAVYGELGR